MGTAKFCSDSGTEAENIYKVVMPENILMSVLPFKKEEVQKINYPKLPS